MRLVFLDFVPWGIRVVLSARICGIQLGYCHPCVNHSIRYLSDRWGSENPPSLIRNSTLAPTAAIHSDSGQGRHTTIRRRILVLGEHGDQGCVLDTPELRELKLVDSKKVWRRAIAQNCKFNDCSHAAGTPGCAIMEALDGGRSCSRKNGRWKK